MTPKEKAKELVQKYIEFRIDGRPRIFGLPLSKQFALIAVDEILEMDLPIVEEDADEFYEYWDEVKQEIENL